MISLLHIIWLHLVVLAGFLFPQQLQMPVKGAAIHDYNQASYWAYPWGKSVVHKGVDIFAKKGTPVVSATRGWVVTAGYSKVAGNYVLILGPKWRFHYYAHLDAIEKFESRFLKRGQPIGNVGDSGNAKGKPCHLHYAIYTPVPNFWLADHAIQGWKKAFYLNPIPWLNQNYH